MPCFHGYFITLFQLQARGIRDDMTLHHVETQLVEKVTGCVERLLRLREKEWTENQKCLMKERIQIKQNKAKKSQIYQHKILRECKTWSGPCTTIEELENSLRDHPDQAEHIVRTELSYFKQTHRCDIPARPELYKLNGIGHEERLESLCILLNDSELHSSQLMTAKLATDQDAFRVITDTNTCDQSGSTEPNTEVTINDLYITLCMEAEKKVWYLGYCSAIENGKIVNDYLHRIRKNSYLYWKYPKISDLVEVETEQVLDLVPVGEWDLSSSRNVSFKLKNGPAIVDFLKAK